MRIIYTTAACALGRLLVATTERGVCSVALGDSMRSSSRTLRRISKCLDRFAGHAISASLNLWLDEVLRLIAGKTPHADLPLDVQATAFQWQVWEELRRIPRGATRSYQQIAEAIGKPKAVRAVARACASNHVALVIPCHRVIREDKGLGGYVGNGT
jgi:AraC family transcriptional regulator of adaptative response/methylated-DNA-[protein]-cysteine methyltransferase